MTRRQVYFYDQKNKRFYISEEFNGDRDELEQFGSNDRCTKSWEEILDELRTIKTLPAFLSKVSKIFGYYKSGIGENIGTRIRIGQYKDIPYTDEVYGMVSGCSGIFLDTEHSYSKWKCDFKNPMYCDSCVFYGAGTSPCRLCGGWIEIEENEHGSTSESDDEVMASI